MTIHKPVLVNEVLQYLQPKPNGLYIDATFGGGGHTRAILSAEPTARVFALDWDQEALLANAESLKQEFGERFTYAWGNFALVYRLAHKNNIAQVDGVLADFGTSQDQLAHKAGFSWNSDTPLDMRMSPSHQRTTAAHFLRRATEKDLAEVFTQYGQEPFSRAIARAIIAERALRAIATTCQLAHLVEKTVGHKKQKSGTHPATQVFQALRIYVNKELDNIHAFLAGALQLTKPDGRIVCISFHSLEDRLVKQFFNEHPCAPDKKGLEVLTPRVITASEEELAINRASRSARLRAAKVC